ncbi:MAG: hypothetical protein N2450_08535 [bacterium]|nr:hypothetical protein [bacterium]
MNKSPIGIIVTRGNWGIALIEEIQAILKIETGLIAISFEPEFHQLERPQMDTVIVWFADAPGTTAERIIRTIAQKGDYLVCGFSLPMLLSFATKRTLLPLPDLLESCQQAFQRGCHVTAI